jgi:hypothetical protein
LLPESNALQLIQTILLGSAIDDSVLQKLAIDAVMVDGGLAAGFLRVLFQLVRVPLLVVKETRIIVALVEILENR